MTEQWVVLQKLFLSCGKWLVLVLGLMNATSLLVQYPFPQNPVLRAAWVLPTHSGSLKQCTPARLGY